ncbi:CPBP family intramembrane glutamic endopeptidase [Saccharococcus thermophilus]|uniref:Membrane protease YdiL (CAAX protease family) n=1 Tax=Saccharococcus thermophilus TaxID=29396 RepID=A0A846MLT3_9BACL|nr:CPBP family intramembrane glutamic endopeptidase [Saccharococcus thermophilus]NIK16553.1 membrane protease YdiL (CAAX protease family) [Saccharococcus thermophilus]
MNRTTIIAFIVASVLVLYLTILNLQYPLIGINVVEKNGETFVKEIYEFGWAKNHNIQVHDRVLKVDGKPPLSHFTVREYGAIEQAKTVTIQRGNQIQVFTISYEPNLISQFMYYLILPISFFIFVASLSVFLLRLRTHDKPSTVLIYFLLLAGLCYISASLSAKYETIGRQIFIGTFLFLPVIFLHFLYDYFEKEKKVWFTKKIVFLLYRVNLIEFVGLKLHWISEKKFLLGALLLNVATILALLGKGLVYLKKDEQQHTVRGLLLAIGLSAAPFVLFYSLPVLIIGKWVLPAELTVTSLFVLPSVFLYLIGMDRLFRLQFSINHFVYYAFLSLLPSFLVTLLYAKFVNKAGRLAELVLLFLLIYVINILALYLKGYFDRTLRAKLYVQKNFYQESIYRISETLKKQKNMREVIQFLEKEVREVLDIENLAFVQLAIRDMQAPFHCDEKEWTKLTKKMDRQPLSIGKIIENKRLFAVFVGSFRQSPLLLIGKKKHPIPFRSEQKDWLSTIVYYASVTIENMLKVEDVIKELGSLKEGIVWQVHMEPEIFAPTLSQVVQREFLDKVLNLSGVLGSFIAAVIGLLIITIEGGKLNWNFGGVLAAIILFAVVLVTNDGFEFSMINSYDVRVNQRAIRMLTLVMSLFQAIATMCVVLISTSVGLFLTEQIGISAFEHPVNQIIVGVTAGIACLGGMTWLNAMLQSTGKVRIAPELSDYTMFVSGYNWKGALSMSLQSSIGEEAIYRLMGIPVIVWLTHQPWLAVLVTSLLWAIIHTGTGTHPRIIRWSEIVALGFVMGELYLQYGFIAALVAHFIHNFILMFAPIALTKSKINRKALPINNAVTKG